MNMFVLAALVALSLGIGSAYARNLLLDSSTRCPALDARAVSELAAAGHQLDSSIAAITAALAENGTPDGASYVRSASLFARVADRLPDDAPLSRPQLALRDLQLLDGALSEAAGWAGVPVSEAGVGAAVKPGRPEARASGWADPGAVYGTGSSGAEVLPTP